MFDSRSAFNSSSIASDAGPLIGVSPASQRRTVRPPPFPKRKASANPFAERPRRLRAERISDGPKKLVHAPADIIQFGALARERVLPVAALLAQILEQS